MPVCSKDLQHLASVNGIEGFAKVNKCDNSREFIFFYSFYKPAKSQNMSHCGPSNSESILVGSQVTIKYRSDPVQNQSIESFGHDGA